MQGSHDYFRDLGVQARRRTFAYAKPHHFVVHDAVRAVVLVAGTVGTEPEAALPSFEHGRDAGRLVFRWTSGGEPRRVVVDAAPL